MARALIVGCGCRGLALTDRLIDSGHLVRATSRRDSQLKTINAHGAEGVLADPSDLSSLMPVLVDVAVVVWLMGSVEGRLEEVGPINGTTLSHLLRKLVDTPVRGFIYEGAGSLDPKVLELGASHVRTASEQWAMPAVVVLEDPVQRSKWLDAFHRSIEDLVGPVR